VLWSSQVDNTEAQATFQILLCVIRNLIGLCFRYVSVYLSLDPSLPIAAMHHLLPNPFMSDTCLLPCLACHHHVTWSNDLSATIRHQPWPFANRNVFEHRWILVSAYPAQFSTTRREMLTSQQQYAQNHSD
jgi:hypothetical protein